MSKVVSKARALVARFEKTPLGTQVFRVVRIAAVSVAAYAVTHNGVDVAAATALVEAAFRQVFPA